MAKKKIYLGRVAIEILTPIIAVIFAFLLGALVIILIGHNPIQVYQIFSWGAFGSIDSLGYTLFNTTSLIFTGLAVAFAFRAGLFNIGGEGQLYIGTFLTAWVGFTFTKFPPFILLPLCFLAALLGGAIWGAIPGILKAKLGVHEVINTIMMNFIAIALTNYLTVNIFKEPGQMIPQTPAISDAARIPRLHHLLRPLGLNLPASNPLSVAIFLGFFACWLAYFILWKTRLGYEIRAVGYNPTAAEYGGIDIGRNMVIAMATSGAFAGLVGVDEVLGYRHRFLDNFSTGLGFTGIAVALLGRNHPLGVIFAALLFGALTRGSLAMNVFTKVPRELIMMLQAIIIILVVVGNETIRRLAHRWIREES